MHKANNLPPSCPIVTKYGNLNFLEPSGPVQACNGTALLYYIMVHQIIKHRTVTLANHIIHLGKRNASKVLKERGNIKMDFIEIT